LFPAGIFSPAAETLQTADAAQPRREKPIAIRAQAIARVPKAAVSIEPQKPDSAKISFAKFGLGRPRKFGRWSRTGRRPSLRRRSY